MPPNRTCSIADCDKPSSSRGWCRMHYNRWQRHGNPMLTLATPRGLSEQERFWRYVEKTDSCWLWTGACNQGGYGQFHGKNHRGQASRFAYQFKVGEIPNGLDLDHLCRNRICVNPDHLEPVTRRTNLLRGIRRLQGVGLRGRSVTVCPAGHVYDEPNTYVYHGRRSCRTCKRDWDRRHRLRLTNTGTVLSSHSPMGVVPNRAEWVDRAPDTAITPASTVPSCQ